MNEEAKANNVTESSAAAQEYWKEVGRQSKSGWRAEQREWMRHMLDYTQQSAEYGRESLRLSQEVHRMWTEEYDREKHKPSVKPEPLKVADDSVKIPRPELQSAINAIEAALEIGYRDTHIWNRAEAHCQSLRNRLI